MSDRGEYTGSVLRIDLTEGTIRREPLDVGLARTYVGGRGFTSRLQYDLIPVKVDPLGPENVLLLAPGALTGTSAPSAARVVVAGRSPLTGILGDANAGGYFGAILKRAGYSLLIVTGRSPHPVYLRIDDDRAELRDARHLWGMEVHAATDAIVEAEGQGFRVAAIGPA
ncbi:MAG TPA: aldehyde ferredoxin oxidoreductase N-terminal domain-containing protein, partial [Anaerolineae bacterium]|nr:aldehyde ferredoxin oxidoreductase N-terminal domain-containing protein [Anaerolineae bacterium]